MKKKEIEQEKEGMYVAIKPYKIILTSNEIEENYGIDAGTLANLRSQKKGCRFFKVNRRVFYRRSDFEAWLFSNVVLTVDSMPDKDGRL